MKAVVAVVARRYAGEHGCAIATREDRTRNSCSNLRGELGEALTAWVLLRHFMASAKKLQTDDIEKDIKNRDLAFVWLMRGKLENELVARLSELADKKIGRTNFHFASRKLKALESEVAAFSRFVVSNKLRDKRNQEIAHREQPEQWFEDRDIHIPYRVLVKAAVMALRLMKRIDRIAVGPSAPFVWRQARKKRYDLSVLPRAKYMIVPHMHLPGAERIKVAQEEERQGKVIWSEMETTINGEPARVLACKEWGLVLLGPNECLALPQYPLQKLDSINFDSGTELARSDPDATAQEPPA